jgi:hypothetical protein
MSRVVVLRRDVRVASDHPAFKLWYLVRYATVYDHNDRKIVTNGCT